MPVLRSARARRRQAAGVVVPGMCAHGVPVREPGRVCVQCRDRARLRLAPLSSAVVVPAARGGER